MRGVATLVGTELIEYSLKNNLFPFWETTEENVTSQRLAKRLGFKQIERYSVYAIEF